MTIFGVDVSSHKGAVGWAKVKAAGYDFAINRAILDTRPDTTWAANNRGAIAAGLIPGAYAFLYPSTSVPAADQCDAFLKVIGSPTGKIIALDVESDGGGLYQPTFADVKAWVARFRHFWPNHPLLIYTGAWYWNSSSHPIHNADASSLGLLWDSRYVAVTYPKTAAHLYASVPGSWWNANLGGWSRVTVLQFTSSAVVPGVSGACDVSAFLGSLDQLRALTGSVAIPTPSPEADMLPLATYTPGQTITVKPTANVRFDAKLDAAIRRVVATTETWAIIGSVKGDVDPDGGSDVWYVRWQAGTYEYTAKSNVTAGPTAPAAGGHTDAEVADLKAAVLSAEGELTTARAQLVTAADTERERLAAKSGELEAARIRAL